MLRGSNCEFTAAHDNNGNFSVPDLEPQPDERGPNRRRRVLYIFDEPTTGLHFDDVSKLLAAFRRLIDAGGSILVIEHNLDVIRTADWIIDLGPEGGDRGGYIVATGTPEAIAENANSYTGRFLARHLPHSGEAGQNEVASARIAEEQTSDARA